MPSERRAPRSPGCCPLFNCAGCGCVRAGGRHFADVVIAFGLAVGQGAAADAVEDAVQRALPNSDVVVHVEPAMDEAAYASACTRRRSACQGQRYTTFAS